MLSSIVPSSFPLLTRSVVPYAVAAVGLVLTLVAVKYISEALADKSIFDNMRISVILALIVAIASFVVPVYYVRLLLQISSVVLLISAIFLKRSYSAISLKTKVSLFNTAAVSNLTGMVIFTLLQIPPVLALRDMGMLLFVLLSLASLASALLPLAAVVLQAAAFHSMPEEVR